MIIKFKIFEGIYWWKDGKIGEEEPFEEPIYDDILPDNGFRQFLLDNNCYEDYLYFCRTIGHFKKREDFIKNRRGSWLDDCFGWASTGNRDFWSSMNTKWLREIKKYPPNLNESIYWWKDGKLGSEEPEEEHTQEFKVGDKVRMGDCLYWTSKELDNINGRWKTHRVEWFSRITEIGYCVDKKGYTGEIIRVDDYWPWWQTTNITKED